MALIHRGVNKRTPFINISLMYNTNFQQFYKQPDFIFPLQDIIFPIQSGSGYIFENHPTDH